MRAVIIWEGPHRRAIIRAKSGAEVFNGRVKGQTHPEVREELQSILEEARA